MLRVNARWLRNAIWRSCASAERICGRAPIARTSRNHSSNGVRSCPSSGVNTQVSPRNSVASLSLSPLRSLPATGWPPRNRDGSGRERAHSRTGRLTLATSVTIACRGISAAVCSSTERTWLIGVATTTMPQSARSRSSVDARSTAPRCNAAATPSAWCATPRTSSDPPRRRRARPSEPPISPRPTIPTRIRPLRRFGSARRRRR